MGGDQRELRARSKGLRGDIWEEGLNIGRGLVIQSSVSKHQHVVNYPLTDRGPVRVSEMGCHMISFLHLMVK